MKKIKKIGSWLLRALIFWLVWIVKVRYVILAVCPLVFILALPSSLLAAAEQEVSPVYGLAFAAIIGGFVSAYVALFPLVMLSISLLLPAYREQKGIAKVWGLDLSNNSSSC